MMACSSQPCLARQLSSRLRVDLDGISQVGPRSQPSYRTVVRNSVCLHQQAANSNQRAFIAERNGNELRQSLNTFKAVSLIAHLACHVKLIHVNRQGCRWMKS